MAKKPKIYPLAIYDEKNKLMAWLDLRGNYHCAPKNKKKVVKLFSGIYLFLKFFENFCLKDLKIYKLLNATKV